MLFSFLSCLNPGDEIIVPEPAYANYMAFAISAGAVIRTISTTIEEGFSLPKVEKFEELINERTRAILICNPNNPTGYLYTRREMNQIRDLVFIKPSEFADPGECCQRLRKLAFVPLMDGSRRSSGQFCHFR